MVLTPQQLDRFYALCCPWMDGDPKSAQDRFRFTALSALLVAVYSSQDTTSVFPHAAILRASEERSSVDLYDTAEAAMSAAKAVDCDMEDVGTRPSDDSVFFIIEEHGRIRFGAWFAHLKQSLVYRLAQHACGTVEQALETGLTLSEEEYRQLLEEMRIDRRP